MHGFRMGCMIMQVSAEEAVDQQSHTHTHTNTHDSFFLLTQSHDQDRFVPRQVRTLDAPGYIQRRLVKAMEDVKTGSYLGGSRG